MRQLLKGMNTELKPDDRYPLTPDTLASLDKNLESVKWDLWHGNAPHALQRMDNLDDDLETLEENPQNKKKLQKSVTELRAMSWPTRLSFQTTATGTDMMR